MTSSKKKNAAPTLYFPPIPTHFNSLDDGMKAFNDRFVYVRNPGLIVDLKTMETARPLDFVKHQYSNRYYAETDAQGVTTWHQLAQAWMNSGSRHEVERLTYAPGQTQFTTESWLNRWRGWGVQPKQATDPTDLALWNQLLDFLFENAPGDRKWFEQWLAYPLQHPGAKLHTSAVLWSLVAGVGKNFVAEIVSKIYGDNATTIFEDDLRGRFNDWQRDKQFIVGDEVVGGENRKQVADFLKTLITSPTLQIEEKFKPKYSIPHVANYLFLSNHPDAFYLDDKDRRFWIWEIKQEKPLPPEFYDRLRKWKNGSGPAALFHYLLNLDLSDFDPRGRAPITEAKREMAELGLTELERWVRDLGDNIQTIIGSRPEYFISRQPTLFTSEELLQLWNPDGRKKDGTTALTKSLRKFGFRLAYNNRPVRLTPRLTARLWVIAPPADAEPWLAITENRLLAEAYWRQRNLNEMKSVPAASPVPPAASEQPTAASASP